MKCYETKPEMRYDREQVWFPLSEDILSWDDNFHELMLNDNIRMKAYERAIKEAVKPGMTVVDIGTGTGILAFWALEAGARKVYGIDVNEKRIPQALERIAQLSYGHERFTVFNALSFDVTLPERVDVCISEILGNLADNEDMTPILADARQKFLKADGIMLPRKVTTSLVPVSSVKAYNHVKNVNCKTINSAYRLDSLLKKLQTDNPFNMYYDCILPESTYVSKPNVVQEFKFDGTDRSVYSVKTTFDVTKDAAFTGFKGSFVAELSDSVTLDISGDDIEGRKTSDCWKHAYLPIETPIDVKKGDRIELTYARSYPVNKDCAFGQNYSWNGNVMRDGKSIAEFSQKTGSVRLS
ncbi:MAG TPA: 50S ribosomal protein L11 methyltransferase [Candidatus Nanoarchaeia archaeon]|nr:50S ribosomal protein L11 methyltransferase [Candidatus Nanoarchaeia archaeon]